MHRAIDGTPSAVVIDDRIAKHAIEPCNTDSVSRTDSLRSTPLTNASCRMSSASARPPRRRSENAKKFPAIFRLFRAPAASAAIIELALTEARSQAARAGRWDVVPQPARELEARRLHQR